MNAGGSGSRGTDYHHHHNTDHHLLDHHHHHHHHLDNEATATAEVSSVGEEDDGLPKHKLRLKRNTTTYTSTPPYTTHNNIGGMMIGHNGTISNNDNNGIIEKISMDSTEEPMPYIIYILTE